MDGHGAPSAPPKEKAILIHALKVADKESSKCYPPRASAWFILKPTAAGPQVSQIFDNIPEDEPDICHWESSYAMIGSVLHVIGGRGSFNANASLELSNRVRRLDTHNPAEGWKTTKMSFCLGNASVTVSGNSIYLFTPYIKPAKNCYPDVHKRLALLYDPEKQDVELLKLPSDCCEYPSWFSKVGIPVDNSGVVVPLLERNQPTFYRHDPYNNSWEKLDKNAYAPLCGQSSSRCFCISNGILYFIELRGLRVIQPLFLSGYDVRNGHLVFKVALPRFDLGVASKTFLVPISDSKLFFMWHDTGGAAKKDPLSYVEILVSLDPSPTICILREGELDIDVPEMLNCIPFDSYQGQNEEEENSLPLREEVDEINKENVLKLMDIDFKKWCLDLLEKNQSLEKDLQFWKQQFNMLPTN